MQIQIVLDRYYVRNMTNGRKKKIRARFFHLRSICIVFRTTTKVQAGTCELLVRERLAVHFRYWPALVSTSRWNVCENELGRYLLRDPAPIFKRTPSKSRRGQRWIVSVSPACATSRANVCQYFLKFLSILRVLVDFYARTRFRSF